MCKRAPVHSHRSFLSYCQPHHFPEHNASGRLGALDWKPLQASLELDV